MDPRYDAGAVTYELAADAIVPKPFPMVSTQLRLMELGGGGAREAREGKKVESLEGFQSNLRFGCELFM